MPPLTEEAKRELRELKALYDDQVIDEDEFKNLKADVLERNLPPTAATTANAREKFVDNDGSALKGPKAPEEEAKPPSNNASTFTQRTLYQAGFVDNVERRGSVVAMVPAFGASSSTIDACKHCARNFSWPAARVQHEKSCKYGAPSVSGSSPPSSSSARGPHVPRPLLHVHSHTRKKSTSRTPDSKASRLRRGSASRKRRSNEEKADVLHNLEQCVAGHVELKGKTPKQYVCEAYGLSPGTLTGWIKEAHRIFQAVGPPSEP